MKIGIITYNHPHQKTQDLLYRLILSGYEDIELIVLPWINKEKHNPLYHHRPDNPVDITIEKLSFKLNIKCNCMFMGKISKFLHNNEFDKILIGGARILPADLCEHKIINAHPGYLPNVRGLDALKWAILNGQPIGVTTHLIGSQPDTGTLIEQNIVPLYPTDTFHSIARRQYDMEIKMLAAAVELPATDICLDSLPQYPANNRMKHVDELRMINRLRSLINKL